MSSYITDVGALLGAAGGVPELTHSTSRKEKNNELDMTDFLQLMVVQLQNQTIDNTMDTSDMLNQMVQMQMITALTNMTDASVMSYASSLVGKEVTIGDWSSGELEEKVVTITGSGMSNGKQVLFAGDEIYNLSSVMAVGRLPSHDKDEEEDGDKTEAAGKTDTGNKTGTANKTDTGNKTDAAGKTEQTNPQISLDDETFQQQKLESIKDFLRASNVSFSDDATEEELNKLVDDYFKSIKAPGEGASAGANTNAQALQAAKELLKANHINMAEDSTDEEILQAAENILKPKQPEAAQDAAAEQKDEENVEEVSGQEQEAPAQDEPQDE